jgi:hypothetical protein
MPGQDRPLLSLPVRTRPGGPRTGASYEGTGSIAQPWSFFLSDGPLGPLHWPPTTQGWTLGWMLGWMLGRTLGSTFTMPPESPVRSL